MSDIEPFFNSAEECAAYETFCAEQERGLEKFELAEPALVCRWRMACRGVPMLNRHIRALSQRVVNGAPLTTNMLSWAKQHVEWSLAAGEYDDPNGVLMLVIDVNGDALMSVGPYEGLVEASRGDLAARAERARVEQAASRVAPELLAVVTDDGAVRLAARPDEHLCGTATLVEQLAAARGINVERPLDACGTVAGFVESAGPADTVVLISDEHGVVIEDEAVSGNASATATFLSDGVAKLFK